MNPQLSIVLIGYNSQRFLKPCLKGIASQTLKGIETIFIDNASQDNSVSFVKKNHKKVKIIANSDNLGYAGAANQGIKLSHGKYVMILNPDLILPPDYLKKIVAKLNKDKKIGAISGKILKYDFEKNKPTKFIDTVGLYCYRNRRVIDRGQGLEDKGQYDKEEEVFGVSGAGPIYRREALEDIKLPIFSKKRSALSFFGTGCSSAPAADANLRSRAADSANAETEPSDAPRVTLERKPDLFFEYFDNDFFMYKEDIDLSWRLRLRKWKCLYYPKAVCYHGRGTGVLKRFSHWEVYKGRRHLNRFQKYYAYKNQRLMQIKNEMLKNLIRDFFPILFKEILIFGYIIIREPYLIKAFGHFLAQLPRALKKRRLIMKHKKVAPQKMAKWLNGQAHL